MQSNKLRNLTDSHSIVIANFIISLHFLFLLSLELTMQFILKVTYFGL